MVDGLTHYFLSKKLFQHNSAILGQIKAIFREQRDETKKNILEVVIKEHLFALGAHLIIVEAILTLDLLDDAMQVGLDVVVGILRKVIVEQLALLGLVDLE